MSSTTRIDLSTRRALLSRIAATCVMAVAAAAGLGSKPAAAATVAAQGGSAIVFGGTGQLGAEIARALVAAGHEVTVFARPSSSRARLEGLRVRFVEGNVLVEAEVERALKERRYDYVIDALGRSESDVSFFAKSGSHIAKHARAAGARQIVLHSSIGVGRSAAVYPTQRLEQMRALFEAKKAGEDAVIASGVPYTIIRNGVLRNIPPEAEDRAQLIEGEQAFGAVSRRGLGRLTQECLGSARCTNRIFHGIDASMPVPNRQ